MSKKKFYVPLIAAMTALFTIAMMGVAWADPVVNNLDATADSGLETATTTAGVPVSVGFFIVASNDDPVGDGGNGCNATGSAHAFMTITPPAGVSVSPTTLEFVGCGNTVSASFTAASAGTFTFASGAFAFTGGKAGSLWNTSTAAFTLQVNPAAPTDTTAPVVTITFPSPNGSNNWFTSATVIGSVSATDTSNVTAIDCTDAASGLTQGALVGGGTATASRTLSVTGEGTHSISCTATDGASNTGAATGSTAMPVEIKIDSVAPTASASASPAPNGNGWNNSDVTVSFSGTDGGSGIASCSADVVLSAEAAGQSASGTCTDLASNVSATATASGISIDKTDPSVSLVGGPADGVSYYFGSVPAAPTCSASDALSGLDGVCSVSGYSAAVGNQTVTASATDKAGNSASASASYTVLPWNLTGFYAPVDMNGVFNVVKGGSTVPLKFEIFAGSTELTDTSYVTSLRQGLVTCTAIAPTDDIEATVTGGTSLRYDFTAGQFVYNWKTPTGAGKCYSVTMTTQDGSTLVAFFKLK